MSNIKTGYELLKLLREYARIGHPGKMGQDCVYDSDLDERSR